MITTVVKSACRDARVLCIAGAFFSAIIEASSEPAWSLNIVPSGGDKSTHSVRSLAEARDSIRQWRRAGGTGRVEVNIESGVYQLPETLELGQEDSGTAEAKIIYQAVGTVRLIAGKRLELPATWKEGEELVIPFTTPPDSTARAGRLGRYRPAFDIIWDSRRLTLARWPNVSPDKPRTGWAYIENVPTGVRDCFICRSIPSAIATDLTGAEVHLFSQPEWWDEVIEMSGYDATTGEVKLRRPPSYPLVPGARFYIQNTRAALDAPGEWWVDTGRSEIHVIAPTSGTPKPEVYITQLQTLLNIDGASHIVFKGFTLEGSIGDAVRLTDVDDCEFINNRISLTGGWALVAKTMGRLSLSENVITSTGLGGIKLSGGDRVTLTSSQITANDNDLSDMGQMLVCYMPAFSLDGVGITVTHNRISHLPHNAIMFSGNNHRISRNLIEDVCLETNDVGAIYAGRDWSSRGTIIEGNVFRNIPGWHLSPTPTPTKPSDVPGMYAPGGLAHGVYLDDLLESSIIRGNVFSDIQSAAIHLGGGSYHTITGNYFVRDQIGLYVSERKSYKAAQASLQSYLGEGSPYFLSYPEIIGRESRDPLTPAEIRMECNHFIDVPRPYVLKIFGPQNIFLGNRFYGTATDINVVLKSAGIRKTLKSWAAWQAAGFDIDAKLNSMPDSDENQAMERIFREAGPRNSKAIRP